jgi:hypothetical protein
MKRLLAIAIALSTLGAVPVIAEQESRIYLILIGWESITPIPVLNLDQCEEQGAKFCRAQEQSQKLIGFLIE